MEKWDESSDIKYKKNEYNLFYGVLKNKLHKSHMSLKQYGWRWFRKYISFLSLL